MLKNFTQISFELANLVITEMFGQVIIGPPGAGKSTYCVAMREFLTGAGRNVAVVNLDPANDQLPYSCAIDVQQLISAADVMDKLQLGPNGALMYCLEYMEANCDWLIGKLEELKTADKHTYVLFDCPGQVELFTHHTSLRTILKRLEKLDFRLVTVNLIDSHYCCNPGNYVSAVLTSLSAMIQLEMPHINVLSKVDLIEVFQRLPFSLDYFTEVLDLNFYVDKIGVSLLMSLSH